MLVLVEARERELDSGVTGGCELPNRDAGKGIGASGKAVSIPSH